MTASLTRLPSSLDIKKASFYAAGSSLSQVRLGMWDDVDYVTFVYDPNSESSPTQTVVALKMNSPRVPATSLSAASGIRFEGLGPWVLAFEPGREISPEQEQAFLGDVLKLLEYAEEFPQNA